MNRTSILLICVWLLGAAAVGFLTARVPYPEADNGLLVVIGLGVISFALVPKMAKGDDRSFLIQVIALALAAKLVATVARLAMVLFIYGYSDATAKYHPWGTRMARHIWSGEWSDALGFFGVGTPFLGFFTGIVYTLTGPTLYGAYFFFSFLAVLGSYFYYKGFRVAFPGGNHRLFALLIFLYPSILFWPAGQGKDALLFFFTGIASYGAARILAQGRMTGLLPVVAGVTGVFMVRPHIAGMLVLAMVIAVTIRRPGGRSTPLPLQAGVITIALAGGYFVATRAAAFLGLESLAFDEIMLFLEDQGSNVFEGVGGGSNFTPTPATDPMWVPMAFLTVLFRPFPWEAHNLQALIQAMDGVFMGTLLMFSVPSLLRGLRNSYREPYLIFAIVFGTLAILGLSTFANFGILARQRATALPFIFMLIAYRPVVEAAAERAVSGARRSARNLRLRHAVAGVPGNAGAPGGGARLR